MIRKVSFELLECQEASGLAAAIVLEQWVYDFMQTWWIRVVGSMKGKK